MGHAAETISAVPGRRPGSGQPHGRQNGRLPPHWSPLHEVLHHCILQGADPGVRPALRAAPFPTIQCMCLPVLAAGRLAQHARFDCISQLRCEDAHALRAFADSHAEPDLNPQGDRAERKLRIVLS
ncbi:unnamed protein product [Symbiodinium sp. KB8]|nr:unnamed protein product [Symbiodinium sp. KB8]